LRTDFNFTPLAVKLERRRKINIERMVQEKAVAASHKARVRAVVDLHTRFISDR
jgi:hypothetical protein